MEFAATHRRRVAKALEGGLSVTKLAPAERHQFVHHYDVEDGIRPLAAIAESPETDRGTALLLYWMLQPVYFAGRHPGPSEQEQADLIRVLEGNLTSGFYASAEIGFDPAPWIAEHSDASMIDARLRKAAPGQVFDMQELEPSYLRAVAAAEEPEIERGIAEGIAVLEKAGVEIPDDPQRLVGAIVAFLGRVHAENLRPRNLKQVGWLWSDALRKVSSWDWACWCDADTDEFTIVLLSEDRKLAVIAPDLVRGAASGALEARALRALFHKLRSTSGPTALRDEVGRGLVVAVAGIPFRSL